MNQSEYYLGVIGCGKMAQTILEGVCESMNLQPSKILVSCKSDRTRDFLKKCGYSIATSNFEIINKCNYIMLGIKPYQFSIIFDSINETLPSRIWISLCAGLPFKIFQESNKFNETDEIFRAMPNMCARNKSSVTPICVNRLDPTPAAVNYVKDLFSCVGSVVEVDEKDMDIVTAISGCGPAYVWVMMEAMIDAGVRHGLSRDVSEQLVSGTFKGASETMIQCKKHPAALKAECMSPGGVTAAGLEELERLNVRSAVMSTIGTAFQKCKNMSNYH